MKTSGNKDEEKQWKWIVLLHLLLFLYSLSSVCSKCASQESKLNVKFFSFYGLALCFLFFYAIAWQQILRVIPLTTAFANKAVTTAWGLLWGVFFFKEQISVGKVAGVVMVIVGVIVFSNEKAEA